MEEIKKGHLEELCENAFHRAGREPAHLRLLRLCATLWIGDREKGCIPNLLLSRLLDQLKCRRIPQVFPSCKGMIGRGKLGASNMLQQRANFWKPIRHTHTHTRVHVLTAPQCRVQLTVVRFASCSGPHLQHPFKSLSLTLMSSLEDTDS